MKPVAVYCEQGIRKAHELANEKRHLQEGQVIGVIGDDIAHRLEKIVGDKAIVWNATQNKKVEYPLNQLFDPNEAFRIAQLLQAKDAMGEMDNAENN